MRSGMDLLRLLEMESQHGPAAKRSAMIALREGAKRGETLTTLMQQQRPYFPPLLVAMTRVGEITGRIDRTLLSLAAHYEHRLKLRRSFLSSIAWPAIQLLGGIFVISLLIYLLGMLVPPGGGEMFDPLGFGLRGATGVLIFWGYLALIFGAIALVIWGFIHNIAGVHNIVPLVYMIPVVGPAIQTITLARFSWTLALCLDSGLDPIQSVELALDSTDSEFYRSASKDAEAAIRSGKTFSEALEATNLFPEDFITHVQVAEMSGTDAESMDSLAAEYDARAILAMRSLSGVATGVVWLTVMITLIFVILRMALRVFGGMYDATGPI